jgi:hypothetical protein
MTLSARASTLGEIVTPVFLVFTEVACYTLFDHGLLRAT